MSSRRDLFALLLIAATLATAHAVATPAMWPVDETSHIAYADHLTRFGTVPSIDAPIPPEPAYPGLDQRLAWETREHRSGRLDIWTANHPPLAFLVQGTALRLGLAAGSPAAAIMLARLTSVLWLLLAVVLTVRLARTLAPDRPRTATVAGLVVATTPTLSHLSGLVFNDVAALTLSTACLLVGTIIIRDGPTPRNVRLLGLAAGLAALTRVSCLPAIAAALVMATVGYLRHRGPDIRPARRLVWAAAHAGLMVVPAAAFYGRNIVRYGDVTAVRHLFDKFGRDPNTPIGDLLVSTVFWRRLWNRFIGDLTTGHWSHGWPAQVSGLLLLIIVGALLWVLIARIIRPAVNRRTTAAHRARSAMWLGCLMLPAALVVTTVRFHSAGGSLHGRYLLGAHAVTAIVIGIAVGKVPVIGRHGIWLIGAPLVTVNLALLRTLVADPNATWTRGGVGLPLPVVMGPATGPTLAVLAVVGVVAVLLLARAWRDTPLDPVAPIPLRTPRRTDGAGILPRPATPSRTRTRPALDR